MMIHSTAIIDPKAEIDENVTVGPYAIINKNGFTGDFFGSIVHEVNSVLWE